MLLVRGNNSVLVTSHGGSILQWQYREHFILGPTRMARVNGNIKYRGDSHWCYPNLGKVREGSEWPQDQHGFVRRSIFNTTTSSSHFAQFEIKNTCRNEQLLVDFAVRESGVSACLTAIGHNQQVLPVLPALHPYFAVPKGGLVVSIAGKLIRNTDLPIGESQIIERNDKVVRVSLCGIGAVELKLPSNCTHVVVWSDNPLQYVCVEPVFGCPKTYGTEGGRTLRAGEVMQCWVDFEFQPEI